MPEPKKAAASKKRAPAKKAAAKKAPAKKAGTGRRTAQRSRQRTAGRPGPLPVVLRGFDRKAVGDPDRTPWGEKAPATVVLAALRAGATWELAAKVAKLDQATPREWNTRGASILSGFPEEGASIADDTPDETVAYLAFHLEAEAARVGTVVSALVMIDRAARNTTDARLAVQAAEIILKRHPEAKPYRPDPRLEVSGPDGGPIPLSLRDQAKGSLLQAAERMAEAAAALAGQAGGGTDEQEGPSVDG